MTEPVSVDHLRTIMRDARARTLELVEGLDGDQVMGPKLTIVNPLRWEIGHVAWFQEKFILRDLYGHAPIHPPSDAIYDFIAIAHDTRWDLPLLSMSGTLGYMENVLEACLDRLPGGMASAQDSYIYQFATFHEDMHTEAYTYTRQTLGYPEPRFANVERPADADAGALPGDAAVPGGELRLGAEEDASLVFDNEKWAHAVSVAPFEIAKAPVTNAEFAAFVDEGGYRRHEHWSDDGWAWREMAGAAHPVYWVRSGEGGWGVRRFDAVEDLAPHRPVVHVNWYEASAYCAWAGRRLASESRVGGGGALRALARGRPRRAQAHLPLGRPGA